MNQQEIQNWADKNNLDVRAIAGEPPYHFRLSDEFGENVLDIYIKMTKSGNWVSHNSVMTWWKKQWHKIDKEEQLQKIYEQRNNN